VGGIPPRPSEYRKRPAPPPARSEQNAKEKFCFPFRRKNGRAPHTIAYGELRGRQIKKCEQNFSVVGRALASGGGAERLDFFRNF